jgi:hypothetical protein
MIARVGRVFLRRWFIAMRLGVFGSAGLLAAGRLNQRGAAA